MKKFKYLKVGIISALILALLCTAAIALTGLFNKDKSDSIEKPEVSATSTAITTGSSALSAWNSAISSSSSTITFNLTQDWNFQTYKPSAGFLQIPSTCNTFVFNGNGHTITGNNVANRLFHCNDNITINNLTIEDFVGSPIIVGSYSLELNNVNVTNCRSVSGMFPGYGGAIYVGGGEATFTDGTISNCTAEKGSAVYIANRGYFSFASGEITDCTSPYKNGAVYLDSNNGNNEVMQMYGGEISNNTGNGVYIGGGEFRFLTGTISNNTWHGIYMDGSSEGSLNNSGTAANATISNNGGAGIWNSSGGTVALGSITVTGNKEGGIFSGTISVEKSPKIYGNTYEGQPWNCSCDNSEGIVLSNELTSGANIYVNNVGRVTKNFSRYNSSTALSYFHPDMPDNIAVVAGEVYVTPNYAARWNTLVTESNATTNRTLYIESNFDWTANASTGFGSGEGFTSDGSIKVPANKLLTIFLCGDIVGAGNRSIIKVDGGTLTIDGYNHEIRNGSYADGAIIVQSGTLNMEGGTITGNSAMNGAVRVYEDANFNMSDGAIENNSTYGVYIDESGTFTMTGGTISGNAGYSGVYANYGSNSNKHTVFNMSGGTISGNGDNAAEGGGVFVDDYADFNFSGGTISGNSAARGGGVYINTRATMNMTGGTISGNNATDGGGVYINADAVLNMSNGTITGNRATGNGGGVYYQGSMRVEGAPKVYGNYKGTGTTLNNIYLYGKGKVIYCSGELTSEANLYINAVNCKVTSGYASHNTNNGVVSDPANYIHADDSSGLTFLLGDTNGEAGIYTNYANLWNALVDCGKPATLKLNDTWGDWTANSSTGFGSGVGFTDNGSIKVPTGKTMTINLESSTNGSYNICGADRGSVGMSTIYIEGTLNLYGTNGEINNCGGGAVAAIEVYGTLNMYGGYIRENSCTGVFVHGTFDLYGGYIENNSCGVDLDSGSCTLTMTGGYIRNNTYDGVTVSGNFIMKGGTISGNGEDGVDATSGAATTIEAGSITGNTGNGIRSDATVTMKGGSITNNTGDGIALRNASLTMSGGTISGNTNGVSEDHGSNNLARHTIKISDTAKITGNNQCGIVIDHERDTVNVEGGTISGNPIGVQIGNGTFNMSGGTVSGNTEGGVRLNGGTTTLSGGTVSNNTAYGVRVNENAAFYLRDTGEIADHADTDYGLYVKGGTVYVAGGYVCSNNGYGVYVDGGSVTCTSGEIYENNYGVYINSGTVTISNGNSDIYSNTTAGVYVNSGTLNMESGEIRYNTNEGVYVAGGEFYMSYGNIEENKTGVYVSAGGTLNMSGGTISGNTAGVMVDGAAASFNIIDGTIENQTGVGVSVSNNGELYMTGGTISGNGSAGVMLDGGAVEVLGGAIKNNETEGVFIIRGTFTMSGTALIDENEGNGVYMYGGVFNMDGGAIGTVDGGNTSSTHGGGVYVSDGEFKMSAGEIVGNTATENGGGVYVTTLGKINIEGGAIVSNNATNGAGIYVNGNAANPVSISNARIQSNTAATSGGGLYVTNGTPTVTLNTVSVNENKANGGNGGGIYINNNGTFNMTDSVVDSNTASQSGAGIYLASGCTAEINGTATAISNNEAGANGGGIASSGCTLTVTEATVDNNTATQNGGGIYVTGGRLDLSDATVSNNDANNGAGLYTMGAAAVIEIENVSFTGNAATADGGAIYVASGAVTVVSATVGGATSSVANTAQHGGGLFVAGGSVDFQSGSVTGNTASETGGGVYLSNGSLAIGNVTVSGNVGGGIVVGGGTISMSGAPKIQNNFDKLNAKSNLVLPEGKKINLTGPFETGAIVYVTGTKAITTYYTTHNSGTLPKVYFYSDDPAGAIILKDGEAYFAGSLADLWNDAVERSTSESPVEFELTADWAAENNSFGEGTGFQDGALYIPEGKSIILTSNGHKIAGHNEDGYTIVVDGKLVIKKNADITIQALTDEEDEDEAYTEAVISVDSGTFEMNAGYIDSNDTGIAVFGGTFIMNGGEITNSLYAGVYLRGSGSVTINDGQIYGGWYGAVAGGTKGGNFVLNGGQIYENDKVGVVIGSSFNGTAEIKDGSKIFDNGEQGVWVGSSASVTISGGEIYNNKFGIYAYGGNATVTGGRIYDNTNSGIYIASNGTATFGGGSITDNGIGVNLVKGTFEMTGGEIYENEGEGVAADSVFKFSGGKIYNNGGCGVWIFNDDNEFTGGEIYGNVTGIYLDASITVSGSLRVYDNFDKNGNPDNINVGDEGSVYVNGALTATAKLHVNYNGVVTSCFSDYNHGAAFDEIFLPDILGSDVTLNAGGEVVMTINYVSMWNKAVEKSLNEQTQVKFTLYSKWTSESNGNFGTTGDGFESGALKVPVGANILFDLNNFALTLNNTTSGGNTTVFKVYGTLEITDTSSRKTGGVTKSGTQTGIQAVNVAANGSFKLSAGGIGAFDAEYAIESAGNVYVAGGNIRNNAGGVRVNGGNAKFEMTGGNIYNNSNIGVTLDGGAEGLISGGSIYSNGSQGVYAKEDVTLTIEGGNIRNNTSNGVYIGKNCEVTMNGGNVYSNDLDGVRISNDSVFTMNGGKIYNNELGVRDLRGTFIMNGGEISGRRGVYLQRTISSFTMNGGSIYGTGSNIYYGVELAGGSFTMKGGSISNFTTGGVYVSSEREDGDAFNMEGGAIYGCGIGVTTFYGTFNMSAGEIYGCTTGVAVDNGDAFNMSGGEITSNGTGVDATKAGANFTVSGTAKVYDNTEYNVKLGSGVVITVDGTLTEAHIGVTVKSTTENFTSGYGLHNNGMAPATYFFSDDSSYSVVGVGSGTTQEAKLGTKVNQSAIVWRYTAKENGSVIESNVTIDGLYMGLDYEEGVVYTVEAINGSTGVAISFIVNGGDTVTSLTVDNIGKFTLTVNNSASQYTNTLCTFEILRVTLDWEYRIEGEGENQWKTVDFDSFEYTGRTYQFRAMLDGKPVQSFDAACGAGEYVYTADETKYVNYELVITILTRKVEVVWNYNNATLGKDGVYYWTYDGFNHAPVASLKNIGGDLAGVINLNLSYSNGTALGAYAPIDAGDYTVTVNISDSYDGNIEISNTEATFRIRQLGLGVQWRDENGTVDSEFTFDYDGKAHGLTVVLDGLLAGELSPVTVIYKQGETVVEAPVNAGTYTAYAQIVGESNYVLREAYSCQIVIEAGEIEVIFTGNKEAGGVYEWTFNGRGRTPAISVVSKATGGEISNFTVEYAPADNTGNAIGEYTTATPVNAGMYVVRVTVSDTEGNVLIQSSKAFEIKQLEVTVTWTGVGGEEVDGVIRFEYDGNGHTVNPSVAVNIVDEYGFTVTSLEVVCTNNTALNDAGSATATATLKDTVYNKNFRIISGSTQKYEVYKKVITSYGWQDSFGGTFGADDTPDYSHGTITGELGPNLTVTVEGLTLAFSYTYSASFEGVWAADVVNGYTVTATLTEEYAKNYEFASGEVSVELTFTITATAGNKVNVNVSWVIFTDDDNYVSLDEYLLNNSIIYNGKVQYPTPVYINNGTYEVLSVNPNTVGADAGDYTATLLPSNLYNYVSGFECHYNIAPLGVTVVWQNSATDEGDDFEYVYNGKEQAPYAYATVDGKKVVATVEGNVNANNYVAVADFGNNYTITNTDEAEKEYEIKQLEISADDVVWSFDKADGEDEEGVYFTFDGAAHAPEATVTYTDGDGKIITVKMAVTGASEAAGTHTAYAVFDGGNAEHTNFTLVGTASTEYRIVSVESVEIIWEFEGAEGNENDGWYWIYNGEEHTPNAYLKAADGTKGEKLNVSAGNTEAGEYVAYVTSDMDFGVLPSHAYAIKAKALDVVWSDTTAQYDGTAHKPTVTVEEGIDGELELGVDYTVTEFTNAGKHTAEIVFLNNNYTFAEGKGSVEFVIKKITLKTELVWGVPEGSTATANENGVYSWQYDDSEHAPVLTFKAAYTLDGEEVVFGEFTYVGLSSLVGTHTVTAALGTATWKGEDISSNFALDTDIRTAQYEITHYVITVVWTADDKDGEEDGIPFWNFDTNAHGPTATYVDWNGDTLTIPYAKETNVNAKAYTATVTLPANCVLAEDSSLTAQYLIKQAKVSVIWEWTDAEGVDADGNPYWTYDGKTEYGPKAYIKKDNGTKGEPLPVHGQEINAGVYTAYVDANNGNYVINDGTDTQLYTINKMDVFVKWAGNTANEGKFVWTYKENVSYAPTAQLIDADGNVILGSDKKPVKVTVTGAMIEVGTYTATAVDGFANYKIVEDETHKAQQEFEIVAGSLKDKNFRWDGGDAKVDGLTFTYTYNGNAQAPVVRVTGGIMVELTITDAEDNEITAITDAGTYKISAKSMDKNYVVPEDLKEVTVIIAKAKVEVVWSDETLIYNGSAQAPSAHFVNAQKTEVSLTVTGAQTNAGKGYVATAAFTVDDGNYELIAKTVTKKFEIEKKDISVEWDWSSDDWDNKAIGYDGKVHMPVATVSTGDVAYEELVNITVYYTVEKDGKLLDGRNLKISDAGKYVVTYYFDGSSAGNYMMSEGTQTFTINKATLTVTLEDDEVNYGAPAPAYGYNFTGFVDGENAATYNLTDADKLNKWLRCKYNASSIPGTYDIEVDEVALAAFLHGNYEIEWEKATLTVNALDGTLIWKWEGADSAEDVIYNGENRKPIAYYKESGTTHELVVTLYTKADYEASNLTPVTEAINAGDYVAVATYEGGVYNFTEQDLVKAFTVQTRAITVVIYDQEKTYGEVAENHGAYLAETVGWDYDGTLPVTGDELEIKLALAEATLTGDLVNAGEYAIGGSWTVSGNYTVTFIGEKGGSTGLFKVDKAEIKVTAAENGVNEVVQLAKGGSGKAINLYSNPLNYLTFTGETPEYKIEFSEAYAEGEEAPSPEDEDKFYTPSSSKRPYIYETGKYVINYRITANPNHEVKVGKWIIEAVYEDEVITVKFVKPYTLTYGEVIPEDLAKALIDSGSIQVTPSAAVFLENVVATAVDANGEPLSGKLSVGRYEIKFSVKERAFSQIVVEGETENIGIIVNKAALAIEWGEVEFDYDETTHTPEISVVVGGEKVKLSLGTNTVNIGGEEVTIIVAVDGGEEIKEAGAYSVLVTVLGDNYEIAEADAHRAVNVKSALTPPVGDTPTAPAVENKSGVPDWLLWVIIAALVVAFILIFILIIVVKRRPAGDTDGFYDDADMEND